MANPFFYDIDDRMIPLDYKGYSERYGEYKSRFSKLDETSLKGIVSKHAPKRKGLIFKILKGLDLIFDDDARAERDAATDVLKSRSRVMPRGSSIFSSDQIESPEDYVPFTD